MCGDVVVSLILLFHHPYPRHGVVAMGGIGNFLNMYKHVVICVEMWRLGDLTLIQLTDNRGRYWKKVLAR